LAGKWFGSDIEVGDFERVLLDYPGGGAA